MQSFDERISQANTLLAPYAVPHHGILGRAVDEENDPYRFPFQRDRDRIIHTPSFRRLKGKTQVFVAGEGDHYRTRLTHTMEVAQISRDIARTLSLNEDLAECIALAHDLGHPPFGHLGEEAIDEWLQEFNEHFEHNLQSHRIVTTLERHSSLFTGLNLNQEVLDGLLKHHTPHDHPSPLIDRSPSLEAQIVNLADEIAYTAHDMEDGLRSGVFSNTDISDIPLITIVLANTTPLDTSLRGGIIRYLVEDIYAQVDTSPLNSFQSLDDVYTAPNDSITFSDTVRSQLDVLRSFLWEHFYMHPLVLEKSATGKKRVFHLCKSLYKHPTDKVLDLQKTFDVPLHIAVKDYVAGMTDSYATQE